VCAHRKCLFMNSFFFKRFFKVGKMVTKTKSIFQDVLETCSYHDIDNSGEEISAKESDISVHRPDLLKCLDIGLPLKKAV